jgi:transcriptional regulator with GAF, ATPase, and Fis domain
MIVIDPRLIDQHADLSEQASVPILPLPLALNQQTGWLETPTWAVTVLSQFVSRIRDQREAQGLRVELKQREAELNAITAFNQVFTTLYPPYEALSKLMIRLRDVLQVEAGALYRLDSTERQLLFEVAFGPQSTLLHQRRISVDEGIVGWVARYRRPLMLSDAASDPRFDPQVDQQPGSTARSLLCLPLTIFGEVLGVLQLTNKLHEESFTKRDLFLLRIIATMISFALVQAPHMRERDVG